MPEMPKKEKNEGYDWEISANAAMAHLSVHLITVDASE
jgi:hypothetical protein